MGVHKSLKGKSGAIPARSRHCNGELLSRCHWGGIPGKAKASHDPESGDLPVHKIPFDLRVIGRDLLQCRKILSDAMPSERIFIVKILLRKVNLSLCAAAFYLLAPIQLRPGAV